MRRRKHGHLNASEQSTSEQSDPTRDWPDKMSLTQARIFLGIGLSKITMLVRSGILKYEQHPLDFRVKLVKRSDLEKLKLEFTNELNEQ
jgi:hypothetical protein